MSNLQNGLIIFALKRAHFGGFQISFLIFLGHIVLKPEDTKLNILTESSENN